MSLPDLSRIPIDEGEDLDAIPIDDGADLPPPPRMRPRRTLTLGEGGALEGSSETLGALVDADAPLRSVPAHRDEKGPARGFTAAERARLEVDEGVGPGALADAAAYHVPGVSAAWDTLGLLREAGPGAVFGGPDAAAGARAGADGSRAAERHRSRGIDIWSDLVSGQEDLGGRNTLRPIVGRDRRGDAPLIGARDALTLGNADELEGLAGAATGRGSYAQVRDRGRAMTREASAQAPALYAGGAAVGAIPSLAASAPTAGGRIAIGAGLGAASGFGNSEATGRELVEDTVLGGLLGAGFSGAAEGATTLARAGDSAVRGAAASMAPRFRRGAEMAQEGADQARLEASGFWGRGATDQIDGAGGPASVAADLRRFRIGQSGGESVPRMQRAASDLASLGQGGRDTMGLIAQTADESGVRVPVRGIVERADALARVLEESGSATAMRSAQRIRAEVAPLQSRAEMTPSQAWRLRRTYDELADFSGRSADDAALFTGDQFVQLRRAIDSELDNAMEVAGVGPQWHEASRMTQLGVLSEKVGAGARRLSVGGGIAGAQASGDIIARTLMEGNPLTLPLRLPMAAVNTVAARAMGQEARMVAPGAIARMREESAGYQRSAADHLYRIARERPAALGQWAAAIAEAGARGTAALSTTINVLAQRSPEARQAMEDAQGLETDEEQRR